MEAHSRREESKRATNNDTSSKTKFHRTSNRLGVKYKRRPTASRLIGALKSVKTPYSTPLEIQTDYPELISDDDIYAGSKKLLLKLVECSHSRGSNRSSASHSYRPIMKKQSSVRKSKSRRNTMDRYVEDHNEPGIERKTRKQKLSLAKSRTAKKASSKRTPKSILKIPSDFILSKTTMNLLKGMISDCLNATNNEIRQGNNLTIIFHTILNLASYTQYVGMLTKFFSSPIIRGINAFITNAKVAWFGLSILEKLGAEGFPDRHLNDAFFMKIELVACEIIHIHKRIVSLLCLAERNFWVISEYKDTTPRVFKRSTMKYLMTIMKNYPNNAEIQFSSCFLLQRLSVDGRNEETFGRVGGIPYILAAAMNKRLDKDIVRKACAALWNLSFSDKNKEKMLAIAAQTKITRIIELHSATKAETRRPDVVAKALGAIWNLADFGPAKSKLLDSQIPELVVDTMKNFRFDDKVQEMGCGCLRSLAFDDASRIGLMTIGASEKILESMKDHISHQGIQYQAFAVLKKLSCNDTNEGRLIKMQAGERILEAMDAHLHVASIQERACGVLWNLAVNDDHKVKLVTIGCAEKMLQAMEIHLDMEQVQFQTCRTLKRLARDSNNEVHLMRLGAAKHVLKAMKRHMINESIQEKGCGVLWNLSERDEHKRELMKLGAAEQILQSMNYHIKIDNVQYEACGALKRLAVDDEIEVKLMEMNAADFVLRAMKEHVKVADVQGQACGVLWNLAFNGQAKLMELDAANQILKAMENHQKNESVQEKACGTLWKLAEVEDNNEQLIKLGVIHKVLAAMDNIKDHPGVQYQACGTLWNLAVKESNRQALISLRAEDRVLNVMTLHKERADILHSACGVLFNLAQTPIAVRKPCANRNIPISHLKAHMLVQSMKESTGRKPLSSRDKITKISNRVLLANKGAIEKLLQCIRAHPANFDVFYQAIAALNHIAQDPKAIIYFLRDPSILQEIVQASDMHMEDNGVPDSAASMLTRLIQSIHCLSLQNDLETLVNPQTDESIQRFIRGGMAKMLAISRTHLHNAAFQRKSSSFFLFSYKILSRKEIDLLSAQEKFRLSNKTPSIQYSRSSSLLSQRKNSFFKDNLNEKLPPSVQDDEKLLGLRTAASVKRVIVFLGHNRADERTSIVCLKLLKKVLQDYFDHPESEFFRNAANVILESEGLVGNLWNILRNEAKSKLHIPVLWMMRLLTFGSSADSLASYFQQRLIGRLFERLADWHGKSNQYKMLLVVVLQQCLEKYSGQLQAQQSTDVMMNTLSELLHSTASSAYTGNADSVNLLRCLCSLLATNNISLQPLRERLLSGDKMSHLLDVLKVARNHSNNFDLSSQVLSIAVALTNEQTNLDRLLGIEEFDLILLVLSEMHALILHLQFGYLNDPRQNAMPKLTSKKVVLTNDGYGEYPFLNSALPKSYSAKVKNTLFIENMCQLYINLGSSSAKFAALLGENEEIKCQMRFVRSLYNKGHTNQRVSQLGDRALRTVTGEVHNN